MEDLTEELLMEIRKLVAAGRLMVFDEDTKTLKSIVCMSMNRDVIQLNAESFQDSGSANVDGTQKLTEIEIAKIILALFKARKELRRTIAGATSVELLQATLAAIDEDLGIPAARLTAVVEPHLFGGAKHENSR